MTPMEQYEHLRTKMKTIPEEMIKGCELEIYKAIDRFMLK